MLSKYKTLMNLIDTKHKNDEYLEVLIRMQSTSIIRLV